MSVIHQIYCTHCTHGSSALEQHRGELAHRMLGYSARAGSLEGGQLRAVYRQIERYIYYYLPRDTPGEEKLRLAASSAPRRMIYLPSTARLQMAAQVCYRQTDTEGRPGSYFAHVLFRSETNDRRQWSGLDCLKLWQARGWVQDDSPDIPFLLPPLGSLAEMLGTVRPAIDDQVLLSFLRAPAGGPFDDPGGVIPQRWRNTDPARRSELLADSLGRLLEIDPGRRESLLLVVEPSMSALLFYGVLRLLPRNGIGATISFSTFEPNADRLSTTLAATHFHDSETTDLRPEHYRSRGQAVNTYLDRRSDRRRPGALYASTMVQRLLQEGPQAVDRVLQDMLSAGARTFDDLERLARVERLVPVLFDPHQAATRRQLRDGPMRTDYLRRTLAREFSIMGDPTGRLHPLLGTPNHLAILELLATEPEIPAARAAVDYLIENLPDGKIPELVGLATVAPEHKVAVLARHVAVRGTLPSGCEDLWSESARGIHPLLPPLLARLDLKTLEEFYGNVAGSHGDAFVMALLESGRRDGPGQSAPARIVSLMDEPALLSVAGRYGDAFFKRYPSDEPALGKMLQEMLRTLPEHVAQFNQRLDTVLMGRALLPEDVDQNAATAWSNCRRAMQDIGRLQGGKSGVLRQRPLAELEDATRQMAEAIASSLAGDAFEDDRRGTRKQKCLRQIGRQVLSGQPLLAGGAWQDEALWQKITWYFEKGKWPEAALAKMRRKSSDRFRGWLIPGGIAAVVLAVALFFLWRSSIAPEPELPPEDDTQAELDLKKDMAMRGVARDAAAARQAAAKAAEANKRRKAAQKLKAEEAARERRKAEEEAIRLAEEEAMQKAAEEESRRLARQQAARRAQEEKEQAERLARQKAKMKAEQRARQEQQWLAWAEKFAREHRGRFLNGEPLVGVVVKVTDDSFQVVLDETELFLGAGRLHFDSGTYVFGEGFEHEPPVKRHEIPKLAAVFGLKSVFVELRTQSSGVFLMLGAEANTSPADLTAQKQAKLDPLQRQLNMLGAQLRRYNKRGASDDEKDEAFQSLRQLLGIEIPPVPEKPRRDDAKFANKPELYAAAKKKYDAIVVAHNQAHARVVPSAKVKAAKLDEEIKRIETEYRQQKSRVRREENEAVARLKQQCRQITAIVYQDVTPREIAKDRPPESTARPPPSEPAESLPRVRGEFTVDPEPASRLHSPAIARVRPLVISSGGKPLPAWFKKSVVIGCVIARQNRDGGLKPINVPNIDTEKTQDILPDTVKVRIRFIFHRRSDAPIDPQHKAIARSEWRVIESIKQGQQYTVKLELPKEELEKLRR